MRGQLYCGHANATALSSSPVVSALGSESDDPVSSPGRGKALCPRDVREKTRAPLLGLAKSIYYQLWCYTRNSTWKNTKKKVISLGVPQFCLKSYIGAAARLILKLHLAELNSVNVWWFLPFKNFNYVCHYAIATFMTVDLPTNACALKEGP